jgi:hypothetical protein
MVNNYYTYAYLRVDGTPYYIGKGINNRAYSKNRIIRPPNDKDRILILKNNLTEEEAFKHEKYMIATYGRKDLGTGVLQNRTDGGDGSSGCFPSEKTKLKISEAKLGKPHSEVHKRRISESRIGKPRSEETKRKISESLKGRKSLNCGKPLSEETRKRMSEARIGKTHSDESKRKMSEIKCGKTFSEETKKKMSEAAKRRWEKCL